MAKIPSSCAVNFQEISLKLFKTIEKSKKRKRSLCLNFGGNMLEISSINNIHNFTPCKDVGDEMNLRDGAHDSIQSTSYCQRFLQAVM